MKVNDKILKAYEKFKKAEVDVRELMKSRFAELLKDANWDNPMEVRLGDCMVNAWIECCFDLRFEFDGEESQFDDVPTQELIRVLERMEK